MDVALIHQRRDGAFFMRAADYDSLWQIGSALLAPLFRSKWYMGIGALDFPLGGKSGGAVLPISNDAGFDVGKSTLFRTKY